MSKIKNVLLIDDDEPTSFINRKVIEASGLVEAIHVAHSGAEALDFLMLESDNPAPLPDLIFLDINMPAMDGWEFVARYQQLSRQKRINAVIVMLTTSLNPEDEVKANGIKEVNAFKSKPLTKQMIGQIADSYFGCQDG